MMLSLLSAISARGTPGRIARTVFAALALFMSAAAQAVICGVTTGGLPFPAYDVYSGTAVTNNATITVACNYQTSDTGAITVNYTMTIPGDSLKYNIYTTNTYGVVWGDGTGGSSTQGGNFKLTNGHPTGSTPWTAYGKIPALQDVSVGNYSDSITISVSY